MEHNEEGVYNLITNLCKKLASTQKVYSVNKCTRKLRIKAYEILLSKCSTQKGEFFLKDTFPNNDPYCHMLTWKFILINDYEEVHLADKLQKCMDYLQISNAIDRDVLNNILIFLLHLKTNPTNAIVGKSFSAPSLYLNSSFRYFPDNKFQLSHGMICSDSKLNDHSFKLRPKKLDMRIQLFSTMQMEPANDCLLARERQKFIRSCDMGDIEYDTSSTDLWEKMSQTKFTSLRTWETMGNPLPNKENPFLSESSPVICNSALSLASLYNSNKQFLDDGALRKTYISLESFMKDVKHVLGENLANFSIISIVLSYIIGISSKTFQCIGNNLQLVQGCTIEAINFTTMQSFCQDLIFCGTCYTKLEQMCKQDEFTGKYVQDGFIYREFCENVKQYLSFYRIAVFSISDRSNLSSVCSVTRKLHAQLKMLASVCRVTPFEETTEMPHGVALLNYLYQCILNLANKEMTMILFSIFYPCCQTYFSHFLQPWLFDGCLNDPYDEFLIVSTQKYISTRGRTYWTRSYSLKEDLVPDFLASIQGDILTCGKSINLLKLCVLNSPLYTYLTSNKPHLMSCCLTAEKLNILAQNTTLYYLQVSAACGTKFCFSDVLRRSKEQDVLFMMLIASKRAATLERIELERLKNAQVLNERKQKEMQVLREQYQSALQSKRAQEVEEIAREIKTCEFDARMQELREKILQDEANKLITYYNNLFEVADKRKAEAEMRIDKLKALHRETRRTFEKIPAGSLPDIPQEKEALTSISLIESKSCDSFYSAEDSPKDIANDVEVLYSDPRPVHSSESMDIINANVACDEEKNETNKSEFVYNCERARRNKTKVMSVDFGITQYNETVTKKCNNINVMSDLQRNKLKVMSEEYGIVYAETDTSSTPAEANKKRIMSCSQSDFGFERTKSGNPLLSTMEANKKKIMSESPRSNETFHNAAETIVEINRRKVMSASGILFGIKQQTTVRNESVDNVHFMNQNNLKDSNFDNEKKNSQKLTLDFSHFQQPSIFTKFLKSPNFELERPSPMSIDSTPMSELTPINSFVSNAPPICFETPGLISTAATNFTDEGFNFVANSDKINEEYSWDNNKPFSKLLSAKDAKEVSHDCLKLFIEQSISIPLKAQLKLVDNELLKHFVENLNYMQHLSSLRNYFFLLDGEFGRNITEGLFEKLYDVNMPVDLINCRTLQFLVHRAIDSSCRFQENSNYLSFKINNLPKRFELGNPDVLDCLSLTYRVGWPLNILLPSDTIGKYDDVFKFLLKLHRVSWVLKRIFQELKILGKQLGKREALLMLSPHYQRVHKFRHIMTQFIQALQNYVVGDVLRTSWELFERDLPTAQNLDDVYELHTTYIKNILFMCLLNQRSAPIRKVIQKIFVVIFKFYEYLRSRQWAYEDGVYTHPNFKKLEDIYLNFEEFVLYFYKAVKKVAKSGYQMHLIQLLHSLDANDYYSERSS